MSEATNEPVFHSLWGKAQAAPGYDKNEWMRLQAEFDRLRAEREAAVLSEQQRCIGIIGQHLIFDSKRAVWWHEVKDCIAAIQARGNP